MGKLVSELCGRKVFRTTGLYVGVVWIILQGADVLLPAFDAPKWVFRSLIVAGIAGAPITAILAWLYEFTDRGPKRQELAEDDGRRRMQGRQMDFIAIGVLALALSFSVFLNFQKAPGSPEVLEPIWVLIDKFDNQTGDPVFDDVLEIALGVGLTGASFINTGRRAATTVTEAEDSTDRLGVESARLTSVEAGITYVVSGTIKPRGSAYALGVFVLDPANGDVVAEGTASARDKSEIFGAVGSLAGQIRLALGDDSIKSGDLELSQSFTAASIEAASDYSKAQNLFFRGSDDLALEYYERAINADPDFGRALFGYWLCLTRVGRAEEAEAIWKRVEFSLHTMTERERLRALGLYYVGKDRNYDRAKEVYERLAERYPADLQALNNLSVAYLYDLEFQRALQKQRQVVEIYPKNHILRRNLALSGMYAGEFSMAAAEAKQALELERNRDYLEHYTYVPLAIAALANGDIDSAILNYRKMADFDTEGDSLATEGLADTAIYTGKLEEARTLLTGGIGRDRGADMARSLARKSIMLASVLIAQRSTSVAQEAIDEALEHSRSVGILFPASALQIELGNTELAVDFANELGGRLQPHSRAYGKLIEGMLAMDSGDSQIAIERAQQAIALADLWLARFHLGIIYLEAGRPAEALSQFEVCESRIGEASAVFLDDVPTWRYTAPLIYWKARAYEAIDMRTPAVESYKAFLAPQSESSVDALAVDARRRIRAITEK